MQTRIIKKYLNRRLYDTQLNVYITLDDIKQYVYHHVSFKVIDAKTKRDLTQLTLLQIILEQETSLTPLFSTDVLQEFIRLYQANSTGAFHQFLDEALQLFVKQKAFFTQQWQLFQHVFTQSLNPHTQATEHKKAHKIQKKTIKT